MATNLTQEDECHDARPSVRAGTPVTPLPRAWTGWQARVKRFFDIIGAAILLIFCTPLMGVIALAIRIDGSGPVIFRQVRIGKNGKEFVFLKFRGMVADADSQLEALRALNECDGAIFKMRNDPRVTRVGRIIRKLSLDELPQLWNVLRGDMSLVGPRPPLPKEVEIYEPWQRHRLSVSPGLTGLWQVAGRSSMDFLTMVSLDLEYISRWSLLMDARILLLTLPAILSTAGAF
jgi:exopolysaccharide biosynthesis polyprenyl glycosylphosphotransferase